MLLVCWVVRSRPVLSVRAARVHVSQSGCVPSLGSRRVHPLVPVVSLRSVRIRSLRVRPPLSGLPGSAWPLVSLLSTCCAAVISDVSNNVVAPWEAFASPGVVFPCCLGFPPCSVVSAAGSILVALGFPMGCQVGPRGRGAGKFGLGVSPSDLVVLVSGLVCAAAGGAASAPIMAALMATIITSAAAVRCIFVGDFQQPFPG